MDVGKSESSQTDSINIIQDENESKGNQSIISDYNVFNGSYNNLFNNLAANLPISLLKIF